MTQIGHHDDLYRSTPLEEKLAWFQNAPGLSAVEPARDFMAGAAALYTDSDSLVRSTLRGLGADWTGDAATNAGATLQRAATWSHDAAASHGAAGETVGGYGESFESLRGKVHWDDPWAWGWNDTASAAASVATLNPAPFLGNLTSDYFTTAQQNRTNDVMAVAALRAHEEQTRTAVDAFPRIEPAPSPPGVPDPAPGGRRSLDDLPVPPVAPAGRGGGLPGSALAGGSAGGGQPGGSGAAASPPGAGVPGIGPGGIPVGQSGVGAALDGAVGGAVPGGVPGPGGAGAGSGLVGGAVPGGVPGADPRLRSGVEPPGAGSRLAPGPLGGEGAGRLGGGLGSSGPLSGDGAGRLGGGLASTGPLAGEGAGRLGGGPPAGEGPGRIGVGVGGGASGGWGDVVGRPATEPGLISRGPTAGPEFASRLPSGGAAGGVAGAAGVPFLGGMGVGAGAQSTEHRNTYWIRSAEPFDVPLLPHVEAVLHGGDG